MSTTVERDNAGTAVQLPSEMGFAGSAPSQTATTVTEAESKSADRDYVVLKRNTTSSPNAPQTWEFVANIGATSAEQAVRRAAETPGTSFLNPDGPTTLVAVPSRSWNPVTLTVKVETTIVLS